MKDLYIISIELDEKDEYFAELTENEAAQLRRILERGRDKFYIKKIKEAAGFNTFADLKLNFSDRLL